MVMDHFLHEFDVGRRIAIVRDSRRVPAFQRAAFLARRARLN